MARSALAGTRIRDRRLSVGIRQAELARAVGISASYLNLIEHNRRRIGGKLLLDIAETLKVDVQSLAQGAEGALLADLEVAADAHPDSGVEDHMVEDFAGRFPGWAAVVAAQQRRINDLERVVTGLGDRLNHDPFLQTSMHEVLSTVTAIRSTAGILAEPGDVDPAWQARFHRNILDDSVRLVEASQNLVSYLDANSEGDADATGQTAQDEVEAFLASRAYHFPELEPGDEAPASAVDALVANARFQTAAAKDVAHTVLSRLGEDARAIPLDNLHAALETHGRDPLAVSSHLNRPLDQVMRRIALRGPDMPRSEAGLVIADGSGTFTLRKPIAGFALPRFGAACPLWPLFQALAMPGRPLRRRVTQSGRDQRPLVAHAIAVQSPSVHYDAPLIVEATMLLLPDTSTSASMADLALGASCRICAVGSCVARREPSILAPQS